jgi:hypothetical protein
MILSGATRDREHKSSVLYVLFVLSHVLMYMHAPSKNHKTHAIRLDFVHLILFFAVFAMYLICAADLTISSIFHVYELGENHPNQA